MKKYIIAGLVLSIFAAGCSKNTETQEEQAPEMTTDLSDIIMPSEDSSEALKIVSGETPADTVIVRVGEDTLSAGMAKMLIEFRIASIINQIPPDRVDAIKANMLKSTVEQFIEKSVLIQEADRRNLEATEQDQEEALAEVATQLPPGMTIDEAIAQSPWGKENLMNEMVASIKTRKLIDAVADEVNVNVSDEEVDAFYAENKDRLDKPERVSASHILIMVEQEDTDEVKAEKKKQIEEVRQRIIDGADFAEMAQEHSVCSSAKMGGALGEFNRESPFVPEFKEAAFSQKVDEVGDIIQTQFGYHIIKVTEKKEAEQMPKDQIKEIVERQSKGQAIQKFVDELKAKADIERPIAI